MPAWLCTGGTVLATHDGPRPIGQLAPGDRIRLRGGEWAMAHWIGRLRLSVEELAARPEWWPVRIAAGALADGVPATGTAVLPECMLEVPGFVPAAAKWLVDGCGVSRPAPAAPLDIYSLVLDGSGAPDAPCQADGVPPSPRPDDPALFALRGHLAARAGALPGALRGSVDLVGAREVGGWIAGEGDAPRRVAIEVVADGIALPPVVADAFRADLAASGIGDGHHAFRIAFAPPLRRRERHLLRVRRAVDGADLPGSPALLDAAPTDLAALLDGTGDFASLRPAAEAGLRGLAVRLGP